VEIAPQPVCLPAAVGMLVFIRDEVKSTVPVSDKMKQRAPDTVISILISYQVWKVSVVLRVSVVRAELLEVFSLATFCRISRYTPSTGSADVVESKNPILTVMFVVVAKRTHARNLYPGFKRIDVLFVIILAPEFAVAEEDNLRIPG
jgi:hypothetical protein